ncbi:MAG: type IV pilus secretin PilQ, partial [Desulfuromonadales bacterium]|nr:type IV pilus secretin PilQ [Desulfuromonadales bacterium]
MSIYGMFSGRIKDVLTCFKLALLPLLVLVLMVGAERGHALDPGTTNTLENIRVSTQDGTTAVDIVTAMPIGYRYTVYDSLQPVRVVIDLPGTDVSAVRPAAVNSPVVKSIRTTPFDLTSGKLGRIELLLSRSVHYQVEPGPSGLSIVFDAVDEAGAAAVPVASPPVETTGEAVSVPPIPVPETIAPGTKKKSDSSQSSPSSPGTKATKIEIDEQMFVVHMDGSASEVKSFSLGAPPRFVVDLFSVSPTFKEREFPLKSGFKKLRVGVYKDKLRLVLDAEERVPPSSVETASGAVSVRWGESRNTTVRTAAPLASTPVTIEAVDFKVDNGHSILEIRSSAPFRSSKPEQHGNIVQFGIENALIPQLIKRVIDTSSFPSAVRLITPYTVTDGDKQNVRFAVELKGPVKYSFSAVGNSLKMVVVDGPFAEAVPAQPSTLDVVTSRDTVTRDKPVTNREPAVKEAPSASSSDADAPLAEAAVPVAGTEKAAASPPAMQEGRYIGQKISLVFDDADIRKILQLIGEVSEMNIIASDDVKGSVTLRLIDVPWDQALDLIMEIQGLGMIQQGNILRVMPKDKISEMQQKAYSAARTQEKMEDLVTEVISISYTELKNVSEPIKGLLTARGKVAEDSRNKQIIITDIPSVIAEAKNLVKILDTPERQVLIEARIVEANASFSRDLGVKWGLSKTNPNAGSNDPSAINVGLGGSFLIAPPTAGSVGQAGFATGITFGQLGIDSTILDMRISALESSGRGKVVSSPRITTLNGLAAKISSGTKIPYQSTDDSGNAKTEFVDANLSLNVTPVINPDNSVILTISASNSSIGSTVSTGAGTAPSIDTKDANTTVLVKDGQTTVIGGIFVEQEVESIAGVPLLQDIPMIGHLFQSKSVQNSRSELLIFITP